MKNARRTSYGWQFYTTIKGEFVSEHFLPHELRNGREPGDREISDWVGKQRALAAGDVVSPEASTEETFAYDVKVYLDQVLTMPTYEWREADLELWVAVFGRRPRSQITSGMIRTQLERWRKEGYAASTVNHRRTAIMHLWTVLDGKSARNPARDVPRYYDDSQDAPPRALSQAAADLILSCMRRSPTRARLELYRWTGWDPATMKRLKPEDVKWDEAVNVPRRKKGQGVDREWLPLLPEAWAALREFDRQDAWGTYSTSSVRARFRHAARQARRLLAQGYAERTIGRPDARSLRTELINVTPKQLRHTFGTLVAASTGDERAAQKLLQQSDIRSTHRYTKASVDPRLRAAIVSVSEALARLASKTVETGSEAYTGGQGKPAGRLVKPRK